MFKYQILYLHLKSREDPETKQPGWILTKLDENGDVLVDEYGHKNEWIVSHSTFIKKYDCDEQIPKVFIDLKVAYKSLFLQ